MWYLIQFIVDVLFVIALLVVAAAHVSKRDVGTELDVFRDFVERDMERIEAKLDGGKTP